jgi:hypothetical protein
MQSLTVGITLILALTACADASSKDGVESSGASTAAAQPTSSNTDTSRSDSEATAAVSDNPQVIAVQLKAAIPEIGKIVEITEDNDKNNLIGRPGKYDAGSFMEDKRLGCSAANKFDDLSVDCGAKLERWPSQADAQARADDIQSKLKQFGLGAEYDYVRDRVLLRVSGKLKPSQAKAYETNFLG